MTSEFPVPRWDVSDRQSDYHSGVQFNRADPDELTVAFAGTLGWERTEREPGLFEISVGPGRGPLRKTAPVSVSDALFSRRGDDEDGSPTPNNPPITEGPRGGQQGTNALEKYRVYRET